VPEVTDLLKLDHLLADWPQGRQLMFCDETLAGRSSALPDFVAGNHKDARQGRTPGPWAILIGPEGGFSAAERTRLRGLPFTHAISLGPRILRADTAVVAALTLWQQALGDWR
jgi:16S rRNA (uracil1498-N3)-methyltransferase